MDEKNSAPGKGKNMKKAPKQTIEQFIQKTTSSFDSSKIRRWSKLEWKQREGKTGIYVRGRSDVKDFI